jgi:hypothetical protein
MEFLFMMLILPQDDVAFLHVMPSEYRGDETSQPI